MCRTDAVRVQLLYSDDCPNWTVTEERLRHALQVVGVPVTIERYLVDTQEAADRLQFQGSPSILIDGRDPFRLASGSFGLTCRIYSTPDGPAGSPKLDQLVKAVTEAAVWAVLSRKCRRVTRSLQMPS